MGAQAVKGRTARACRLNDQRAAFEIIGELHQQAIPLGLRDLGAVEGAQLDKPCPFGQLRFIQFAHGTAERPCNLGPAGRG